MEASLSWEEEFPDHKIDKAIEDMVAVGYVRDTSRRFDPAPSFSAALTRGRWLRLWVEHPDLRKRRAGPQRYRVEVARSLRQEGRPWIETDSLPEAISYMMVAIEQEGFRLSGAG